MKHALVKKAGHILGSLAEGFFAPEFHKWNLDVEFFLEDGDDLHIIDRLGLQILDESRLRAVLAGFDLIQFSGALNNPSQNFTARAYHAVLLLRFRPICFRRLLGRRHRAPYDSNSL